MTSADDHPQTDVGLEEVVAEIERHVAATGWDQPPRLYALVDTLDLIAREPALAEQLGLTDGTPYSALTPIEQEDLPEAEELGDVLAQVAWPPEVIGCSLALEVMWGEGDEDPVLPSQAAGEGRLVVAVLRDGGQASVLRVRGVLAGATAGLELPDDGDVLSGADLAPGLAEALLHTLDIA